MMRKGYEDGRLVPVFISYAPSKLQLTPQQPARVAHERLPHRQQIRELLFARWKLYKYASDAIYS